MIVLGARACIGRLIAYLPQIDYELALVGDSVSELQHTPTSRRLQIPIQIAIWTDDDKTSRTIKYKIVNSTPFFPPDDRKFEFNM